MKNVENLISSHPYHSAIPGQRGGSKPAVANDHLSACNDQMDAMRQKVPKMFGHLKSPVSRLK